MFTRKSLAIGCALLLALACTGVIAADARTAQPQPARRPQGMLPPARGIAAISVPHGNQNLLSFLDVRRYLHSRGFIGGPTLSGKSPDVQDLRLTNILDLNNLLHFTIPHQPGNEQVYYAHLKGPMLVLPDLPLPVLSTLLPSLGNLPAFLPHLGNLSSLGLTDLAALAGLLPLPQRMPDLSNLPSNGNFGQPGIVLPDAYEVFDAHSGNLLAWG